MKIEIAGQKCIKCEKPATTNLQKLWVKWGYNAVEDKYSSQPEILDIEPPEWYNLFLCDVCLKLWECGKI